MAKAKKDAELVPGFTYADSKYIADQILGRTDGNHPMRRKKKGGLLELMAKHKPDPALTAIFAPKVSL